MKPAALALLLFLLAGGRAASAEAPAASVQLPANPVDVAAGDVDGDGSAEIALLLVYPGWGSAAEVRDTREGQEVDVVAAIEDRRELRIYDVERGSLLALAAPPLTVGGEVFALDALPRGGPVVAMTATGPATLAIVSAPGAPGEPEKRLVLVPVAQERPLFAGVERFFSFAPLVADVDGDASPESLVPTASGIVAVRVADGRRLDLGAPLADVSSGSSGRLRLTLPRTLDVDRDGTVDLLDVARASERVALRRGLGGGRFAPAEVWDLSPLLARRGSGAGPGRDPFLLDVLDVDADGTLEAAIVVREGDDDRPGLRELKQAVHAVTFHALVPGQPAATAAESTLRESFTAPLPLPRDDSFSPFIDLDGDGRQELLAFDLSLGYFGIAKAVATGAARVGIRPRAFRRTPEGWQEVDKVAPAFDVRVNLRQGELRGFALLPGDVTGDGVDDMLMLDDDEVRVHPGRRGGRIEDEATLRARLPRSQRGSTFLPTFVDLDGDGALELVAAEQLEQRDDDAARPVQLSVHRFAGQGRP